MGGDNAPQLERHAAVGDVLQNIRGALYLYGVNRRQGNIPDLWPTTWQLVEVGKGWWGENGCVPCVFPCNCTSVQRSRSDPRGFVTMPPRHSGHRTCSAQTSSCTCTHPLQRPTGPQRPALQTEFPGLWNTKRYIAHGVPVCGGPPSCSEPAASINWQADPNLFS